MTILLCTCNDWLFINSQWKRFNILGVKKEEIIKSSVYKLLIPSIEESAKFLSEVFKELNHKGKDFYYLFFNIQNEEMIYKFYCRHVVYSKREKKSF